MTELQWFLTEQVEEEKTAREIVAKFRLVKNDPAALLDIDRELAARTNAAATWPAERAPAGARDATVVLGGTRVLDGLTLSIRRRRAHRHPRSERSREVDVDQAADAAAVPAAGGQRHAADSGVGHGSLERLRAAIAARHRVGRSSRSVRARQLSGTDYRPRRGRVRLLRQPGRLRSPARHRRDARRRRRRRSSGSGAAHLARRHARHDVDRRGAARADCAGARPQAAGARPRRADARPRSRRAASVHGAGARGRAAGRRRLSW